MVPVPTVLSFAWGLVENAESGTPSQTYRMRNSWEVRLGNNLCVNKPSGDSDVYVKCALYNLSCTYVRFVHGNP